MAPQGQISAAIKITQVIAETIKEATQKETYAISGHIYAALTTVGVTLNVYEALLSILVEGKLVRRNSDHTLVWIGPM